MKSYLLLSVLAQWGVGEDLPRYERRDNLEGPLVIESGDGLGPLGALWSREFASRQSGVRLRRDGPPGVLVSGRPLDAAAQASWGGRTPVAIRIGMDAIAIWVHKDNPLQEISLEQLEAIYTTAPRRRVESWGSLGLKGDWESRRIVAYRRPHDHPHTRRFRERVLGNGGFHDHVFDDFAGIVQSVAIEPAGIGFANVGAGTRTVKMLRVSSRTGKPAHGPEDTPKRTYPLGRYLYLYVDRSQPAAAEFARFALSREGQLSVMTDGWLPVPAEVAAEERAKLR